MAGWKFNILSLTGRIVLTQSVTSTIPGYVMQCTALPPNILQWIDKLNRNFLWGNSETRKKVHLIGWNKITKAKEDGGLGIHVAKQKNTTLLAKLNWRFHTEKSSLWVRVLFNKYRGQRGRFRNLACPPTSSPAWIGLKKGEATFLNGSKWIAGRNNSLFLWFDKWMNKDTLRSQIEGPLNKGEENLTLRDMSNYLGWNWESLSFAFPKSLALPLLSLSLIKERICYPGIHLLMEILSLRKLTD